MSATSKYKADRVAQQTLRITRVDVSKLAAETNHPVASLPAGTPEWYFKVSQETYRGVLKINGKVVT